MLQEAALALPGEPIQIKIPPRFTGELLDPDATELYVNHEYDLYTLDEINLIIQPHLPKLMYNQRLSLGALLIGEDPLYNLTHQQLDYVEQVNGLTPTRTAPGGGERTTRERVLILREDGYRGTGGESASMPTPTPPTPVAAPAAPPPADPLIADPWLTPALAFFNGAENPEQITSTISEIAYRKARELLNGKPYTIESLNAALTNSVRTAVAAHFTPAP